MIVRSPISVELLRELYPLRFDFHNSTISIISYLPLSQSLSFLSLFRPFPIPHIPAHLTPPLIYSKPTLPTPSLPMRTYTNCPTEAIRRKSLSPYTFRSGTPHIPTGTITSVSSYNLMHDPDFYPNPNTFDGLRYTRKTMPDGPQDRERGMERENPMYGDSMTEVKREFPVWGFGGHVWFVMLFFHILLLSIQYPHPLFPIPIPPPFPLQQTSPPTLPPPPPLPLAPYNHNHLHPPHLHSPLLNQPQPSE